MYTVDLYLRVRLACHVDGLSQREAASRFGIARETVRKMLRHSEPPGYRRRQPPKRPKLAPFTDIIDRILEEDRPVHRKQHHTAKRIFERLRDEHGFTGKETIVKDYVRNGRFLAQGRRSASSLRTPRGLTTPARIRSIPLCGDVDAAGIRMPLHRFAGTIRRNKHRDDRAHGRLQNPLAQNDVRAGEPSRRWEARWNKWKGQPYGRRQRAREVFLKSASTAASCAGWRGRALMCENPRSFNSRETERSW